MVPFLVSAAAAVAFSCAGGRSGQPSATTADEEKRENAARWPDSWGAEFGLRCAAAGEDIRVCTCVANEVQKTYTPEQFRSLGPEALREGMRVCRERLGGETR